MNRERTPHAEEGIAKGPDMRAAVRAIADNVGTSPAALAFLAAAYDVVTVFTPGPARKVWGRAQELLAGGWTDYGMMKAACQALSEVVEQVVALTDQFRQSRGGGGFVATVVSLTHLSVLLHVAQRRTQELREAQAAAAAARDADESAGGGNKAA